MLQVPHRLMDLQCSSCYIFQDVFEDDSNIHMVMELCTGGSILEHLKGGKPLSEAIVADISRCILRFIAQCHTKCALLPSELKYLGAAQDAA